MLKGIKNLINRIFRSLDYRINNVFFQMVPICRYGLNTAEVRDKKIIVSLTSYPKRFDNLHLVIKSIMRQSMKPDKIILYLGDDSDEVNLPPKLRKLEKKGLTIVRYPENLKCHKKYFYAMQEYPQDIVITVDDDLLYEKHLIRLLIESYRKYPEAISAKRVHRMTKDVNGKILKYNEWEFECTSIKEPSMELFATGCGGILYPPHCMGELTFDKKLFSEKCMNADDVWLKFMQILNRTPVVYVAGRYNLPMLVKGSQKENLNSSNVAENMNDVYIKNLEEHLDVWLGDYCK